jgi:hypothetical protein
MGNYKVVTITSGVAPAWYFLQNEFYQSLKGYDVLSLQPEFWGGLSTKPKVLYAAIKNGTIDTKYIIFTDSWDMVFAGSPDEVMSKYKEFECPLVISAEKNCFPEDTKAAYDALNSPTKYKYLNSGFIVGETEAILACLEAMDLPNLPDDHYDAEKRCNVHPNDQFEFQKIFLQQPVKIKLDCFQELSQTLHDADVNDFDFSKNRIRNIHTGSYPITFHFNGGSKDKLELRNPILQKLKLLNDAAHTNILPEG